MIFMEPKILYRSAVEQVPIDDFELPLGRAETLISGADLTLLTWGTPVYNCETALHMLANPPPALAPHVPAALRTAKVELIDLRTILPWDAAAIAESVARTGRLVIVHEAGMTGGVGAEIAAEIQKRCFLRLAAPVKRVTGWECVSFFFSFLVAVEADVVISVHPWRCSMRSFIFPTRFGFLIVLWKHCLIEAGEK